MERERSISADQYRGMYRRASLMNDVCPAGYFQGLEATRRITRCTMMIMHLGSTDHSLGSSDHSLGSSDHLLNPFPPCGSVSSTVGSGVLPSGALGAPAGNVWFNRGSNGLRYGLRYLGSGRANTSVMRPLKPSPSSSRCRPILITDSDDDVVSTWCEYSSA